MKLSEVVFLGCKNILNDIVLLEVKFGEEGKCEFVLKSGNRFFLKEIKETLTYLLLG